MGIMELSGKSQSLSVNKSCESLEKSLKTLHKSVQVCRLTSELSSKQEKFIGLDQTSQKACLELEKLGTNKGKEIHQDWLDYLNGKPQDKKKVEDLKMLHSIFSNLPKKEERLKENE